jgi:hypothetical protein
VPNAGTKIKTGSPPKLRKGLTKISPTQASGTNSRRAVMSLMLVNQVWKVTHDLQVERANPSIRKVMPTTLRGWVQVVRVRLVLYLKRKWLIFLQNPTSIVSMMMATSGISVYLTMWFNTTGICLQRIL